MGYGLNLCVIELALQIVFFFKWSLSCKNSWSLRRIIIGFTQEKICSMFAHVE